MIKILVALYLIGLLIFYTFYMEGQSVWAWAYYLWDKSVGAGMLMWYSLYIATKRKRVLVPVVWFSAIRFVWEITSAISCISVSNTFAVAVLFLILTVIVAILSFMEESPVVRFLEKNIF